MNRQGELHQSKRKIRKHGNPRTKSGFMYNQKLVFGAKLILLFMLAVFIYASIGGLHK